MRSIIRNSVPGITVHSLLQPRHYFWGGFAAADQKNTPIHGSVQRARVVSEQRGVMYLSAAFDLHLYAHWSMYVWEGQLMCLHVFWPAFAIYYVLITCIGTLRCFPRD